MLEHRLAPNKVPGSPYPVSAPDSDPGISPGNSGVFQLEWYLESKVEVLLGINASRP